MTPLRCEKTVPENNLNLLNCKNQEQTNNSYAQLFQL